MTYLQYHLVFIVPPLLALLLLTWRATRGGASVVGAFREAGWARRTLALFPLIPLVYTTPWDNYLVYKAVWSYPPERVLGRIGYVPYEEYAFFILQTLITGLGLAFWLRRGAGDGSAEARVSPHAFTRWGQAALWLGVAFVGVLLLGHEHTFYLGLILAWACPVLSGLSAFGGDLVFGRPRVYWLAVLPPTLYLWATDYFAIQNGIWGISPRYTLGWNLGGVLPAEEMAFFFITNLLVVTGLLSFLHPEALNRVNRLAALIRTGTLRPWMVLTALYALSKIPVPLWPAGFPLLGTLGTGLLFLAALSFAWERVGAARALLLAGLAFAAGLGVELLGSRTGLPFGQYSYAHAPGLLLLGVPLLVPLGWFAMTLAAALLARGKPWLTGLLLVAWDVGLEPLMTAQGFWRWDDPAGLWAGAPIQNFLGWFVVGAVLAFVMREVGGGALFADAGRTKRADEAPSTRFPLPLTFAAAYLLEAAFLPAGLLLLGAGVGTALLTLLCMGGAAALALWPLLKKGGRAWTPSRRI